MRRGRASWRAGLAAALLLGCAGAPSPERSVLAGNPAHELLILPLNVAAVMPPDLEAASPIVWEELELYLREQGKKLKTVAFADARRLWLASIREARAADARAGYADASRVLVEKLARHTSFDALIAPSLYLRAATIVERIASWDGVERPLEIEPARRLGDTPLEGVAPAASLHAAILDARGNELQQVVAGMELLVRIEVTRKRGSTGSLQLNFVPREEIFTSREHVREAIARALAPFLPPLPPHPEASALRPDPGSSTPRAP